MVDVDGVVIIQPEGREHWADNLERDLGVPVADLRREFFQPYWEEIIVGRAPMAERLAAALTKIAPRVHCEDLISYWFEKDSQLDSVLLNDIAACRDSGLRIYFATNQEHMRAAYLMEGLGLSRYVDGIFYSGSMGCRKPQRNFYRAVEIRMDLNRSEILLIDDTLANVEAAREAGWTAVHWTNGMSLPAIVARFTA
ncbi:haloacid dehalogenase [Brucella endophytica]|uniref:Haloacid dehalogenase n=1 Tax=Brucella endophytica TaxID=1963359 RepID=A0A916SG25_9HYPH|nr:haloacid dehalogenase [Brucella endophytica]